MPCSRSRGAGPEEEHWSTALLVLHVARRRTGGGGSGWSSPGGREPSVAGLEGAVREFGLAVLRAAGPGPVTS